MFAAVLQAGSHRIVRAHDLLGLGRLRARWRVGVKALALVFWPLGRWRWRWRFMALGRRWVGVEAGPLTTHVAKAGRKVSARSRWLTTALTRNTPGSGSALGLAHTKEMINLSNLPTCHLFGCADERPRESEEQTMRAKPARLHVTCVEIVPSEVVRALQRVGVEVFAAGRRFGVPVQRAPKEPRGRLAVRAVQTRKATAVFSRKGCAKAVQRLCKGCAKAVQRRCLGRGGSRSTG